LRKPRRIFGVKVAIGQSFLQLADLSIQRLNPRGQEVVALIL
jgi:hypothetical protein